MMPPQTFPEPGFLGPRGDAVHAGPAATVISLVDVRARRRADAEAAALESILESARSIDIVRLFELKLAREAKQQAIQT